MSTAWRRRLVGGAVAIATLLGVAACAPHSDDEGFGVDADPTACPKPTANTGKNVEVVVCRQSWIAGLALDQENLYFLAGETLDSPYADTLRKLPLAAGGSVEALATFNAKHDLPSDTTADNGSWLAVNSTELVWAVPSTGQILAVSRTGGTPRVVASGQDVPLRVAVDETRAYWTNWSSCGACAQGTVRAVDLEGGEPLTIAMKQDHPNGIAVDRLNLYWVTAGGNVMQVPLIGGTPITLATGLSNPFFVTVDATTVYWTLPTSVMSCPILGCNKKPTRIATGLKGPNVVSSDANAIYFSDWDAGTILKLVKGQSEPTVIARDLMHPNVVVLSNTHVYWHTAGPEGSIMRAPK